MNLTLIKKVFNPFCRESTQDPESIFKEKKITLLDVFQKS